MFSHLSFYSTLVEIFTSTNPPKDEPRQESDDFEIFGALRFAFGRVSSSYRAGFMKMLRWAIDGYEEDQGLIISGVGVLAGRLGTHIFSNIRSDEQICLDVISHIGKRDEKITVSHKKERCMHLVKELVAVFLNFTPRLVPIDNDYDRYVTFHDWLMDSYAGIATKLNVPRQDVYTQQLFF
ncbi:hypothetical protein PanWU01x14_102200 [Parasponia andersonii]|uniref:Uncharacterized protein n=1 Tax=Parasponia andersonii TaxID=3476 RepID=A0A2P5D2S3_PARAD|nr:hypothetical protein PanWU01x14_102200 [Parasponia andersonii]